MTNTERVEAIQHLIQQYESELGDVLHTSDKFELDRLPPVVRKATELVVAKAPKFSNIAALGMANHALSHTIGQCRPYIDDIVYSSSHIGLSTYSVILSGSGSGKSSSYNNLLNTFKPAIEMINSERRKDQYETAKAIALREIQKEDPKFKESELTEAMIESYLSPLPRTSIASGSTRGGASTLLAKLQKERYSAMEIVWDELGLALKSGGTTAELMDLITQMFDLGNASAPEFKHDDVKETTIESQYISVMAHTSPSIVFKYKEVKESLYMLYVTALARRTFFFFPDEDEAVENNQVPTSTEASREIARYRRQIAAQYAPEVSQNITNAVHRLLENDTSRKVTFHPDAADLYDDYFEYCSRRAELMEDSSIQQIEIAGRSFKIGKLAGIWALASGISMVTYDILASAIYLSEYSSKYLDKFEHLTHAKPHELLAEVFLSGKEKVIPLDTAISRGYVSRISKEYIDLLDPLNSRLSGKGVARYDTDLRTFIYEPFKFSAPESDTQDTPKSTVSETCHFSMSYKIVQGMPKDDRSKVIHFFDKYRDDLCMKNLTNLVSMDTIYSTFRYGPGATKKNPDHIYDMFKSTDTIISSTNLVVIDVDESDVPMDTVAEFIQDYQYLIATTSNTENRNKFRILLPINVELDGSDPKKYSFVVRRIATDLLVHMDPASANISLGYYGYQGADTLYNTDGKLFDITGYLTEYAKGEEVKPLHSIYKPKSPKARKANIDKLMDNVEQIFEYAILAPMGQGSYQLARACLHLIDEGATKEELATVINYINSRWEYPMEQSRLDSTLIEPFSARVKT